MKRCEKCQQPVLKSEFDQHIFDVHTEKIIVPEQ